MEGGDNIIDAADYYGGVGAANSLKIKLDTTEHQIKTIKE
jgi:hypothetical protein